MEVAGDGGKGGGTVLEATTTRDRGGFHSQAVQSFPCADWWPHFSKAGGRPKHASEFPPNRLVEMRREVWRHQMVGKCIADVFNGANVMGIWRAMCGRSNTARDQPFKKNFMYPHFI